MLSLTAQQQNNTKPSVERSIYGVQTGLLGFWGFNESRLNDQFALRGEVGLEGGFSVGGSSDKFLYILIPNFKVESRWYRNLERRVFKGMTIANNSADFLSLKATLVPDLFCTWQC